MILIPTNMKLKSLYVRTMFRLIKAAYKLAARIGQICRSTDNRNRHDPWRCEACGSLNIQQKAWIDPNFMEIVRFEDCDRNDYYCAECEENRYPVRESELLQQADEWWGQTDFRDMERLTRYRQLDFSPEDGCQSFVDACNEWWRTRTIEEKISIHYENR